MFHTDEMAGKTEENRKKMEKIQKNANRKGKEKRKRRWNGCGNDEKCLTKQSGKLYNAICIWKNNDEESSLLFERRHLSLTSEPESGESPEPVEADENHFHVVILKKRTERVLISKKSRVFPVTEAAYDGM